MGAATSAPRSPWQMFWREFRKSPVALFGRSPHLSGGKTRPGVITP